jgi:hypothetical protein
MTLAIFIKLTNKPSLRALAKQSISEFQLKIDLDCFASARKDDICRLVFKKGQSPDKCSLIKGVVS